LQIAVYKLNFQMKSIICALLAASASAAGWADYTAAQLVAFTAVQLA